MRPNNICCIVIGEYTGWPACCVIAFKCPEVRVTILDSEKFLPESSFDTKSKTESDLEQIVRKCRNRNLFFSSSYSSVIKEADLIFISINDSDTAEANNEILKQLERVVKQIGLNAESNKIVVENSKIPMQTAEKISRMLPSPCQSEVLFQVISNPEFMTQGSALDDLLKPDCVLIGCQNKTVSRAAAETLCELYERWIPRKNILILNYRSAELCKIAGGALMAQQIASVHSLFELCERTEVDLSEMSYILNKDSKIGSKFLKTFPGFTLFQKEISSLISMCLKLHLTEVANYWQAVKDMNEYQKSRRFSKIESIVGPPKDKEIALWGFSTEDVCFEANNFPAVDVCRWLLAENSKIKIYDPKASAELIQKSLESDLPKWSKSNIDICSDAYSASSNAAAIIVCVDRDEFANLDYSRIAQEMQSPIIIDGKFLKEESVVNCGIRLYTIGLH